MEFEWDTAKAVENYRRHGVTFYEATTVFGDPLAISFPDPDHSETEDRYLLLGLSADEHTVVVAHTDRWDRLRIISAHRDTRREQSAYEEER